MIYPKQPTLPSRESPQANQSQRLASAIIDQTCQCSHCKKSNLRREQFEAVKRAIAGFEKKREELCLI